MSVSSIPAVTDDLRFTFGKNWKSFIDMALNQRRIAGAVAGLRRLLHR